MYFKKIYFYLRCPFCSEEHYILSNFGRGPHEEDSCEIGRFLFSNNSIFSSGGHFVQLRKNVKEFNFGKAHGREYLVKLF